MHNSEFEKSVQEKMDALKLAPSGAVWEKVEASLPAERRPKRFLFFLLAVLLFSLFFVWNLYHKNDQTAKNNTVNNDVSKEISGISGANAKKDSAAVAGKPSTVAILPGQNNNLNNIDSSFAAGNSIYKKSAANHTKIKIKPATAEEADNAMAITAKKTKSVKSAFRVQVKQPAVTDEATAVTNVIAEKSDSIDSILSDTKNRADTVHTVTLSKNDTLQTKTVTTEKKSSKKKWIAGIETGAGISYLKTKVFDAASPSAAAGTPAVPSAGATASQPPKPSAAFAWGAGVYVQRELNTHFTFHTGVSYQFLSATMKVGNHIDSSIRAGFNTAVLSANNYYLAGTSAVYKNKFHLLELPLVMQYKPSASSLFYVEGGASLSWLLHSNALVYGSSAYISSNNAYNKLLLSFNAGAGMKIPQKRLPGLEAGIRAGYMFSSAVKPVYGAQYPFSAKLFLRMPLKK